MCIDIVLKTIIKIGIFLKQIRTDTQENMLNTLKSSHKKESKLCSKFILMPVYRSTIYWLQWGSEYRTSLVFKWSKVVWSPNGSLFQVCSYFTYSDPHCILLIILCTLIVCAKHDVIAISFCQDILLFALTYLHDEMS